ncbi:MAG: hypothetical protein ACREEV_10690 [Dongiaceae bacterium]
MGNIRSVANLLLILALVVGSAASFMPMTTTPAMSMDSHDGCKGCTPAKMTVADCGAICVPLVAIFPSAATVSASAAYPHWPRPGQSVRTDGTEPPTAPPRS